MKKWFENVKVSKKLSTGFLAVAMVGIITGLVGIISLVILLNAQQQSYNNCTLGIEYAAAAKSSFQDLRASVRDLVIYYDTNKSTYCDKLSTGLTDVQDQIDKYGQTVSDATDKANYDAMSSAFTEYENDINDILKAAGSGKTSEMILATIKDGATDAQNADQAFDAVVEYNDSLAANTISSNKATAMTAIIIMIVLVVTSLVFSLSLSKFISGIISNPLHELAVIGELLADGDIDVEKAVTEESKQIKYRDDELGSVAKSYNKMISGTLALSKETAAIAEGDLTTVVSVRSEKDVLGKSLEKLVNEFTVLAATIISSADQVDSGAKQVANSSMSLSQGATEQASSVEELSASIADVTHRIKENADEAEKAKVLSAKSGEIMRNSVGDMELTRKAMEEITSTSKNISKVIKAIDDIAFQTNILALNAAVEAARAGAAGKGFAVVADEVRNLSQKSAEAAKNTTTLIESSISAVEKGTELVNKANSSFTELASQATEVNRLVEQISVQAQEQAAAISQISIGVEQVSSVIQMNSATSEESAAASEELSSQANYLKESAGRFKIKQ